jgi:hypothetical protein
MNQRKAPSLADLTLNKPMNGYVTPPPPAAIASPPASVPRQPAAGPEEKRIGQTLRLLSGAHKQLKQLALDVNQPVHDLLIEAVNDLFTKYGKPPIA